MEQLIYQLDLPDISQCVLDGVTEQYFLNNLSPYHITVNPREFFKPEYLTIMDIRWAKAFIWLRNAGVPGKIHTDRSNRSLVWGINWIHRGYGLMEYWDYDNFDSRSMIAEREDDSNHLVYTFKPDVPANQTYLLPPGAYLVNTVMPHRATGFQHRHCVSYRSDTWMTRFKKDKITDMTTLGWSDVVGMFERLILDNDLAVDCSLEPDARHHRFEEILPRSRANNLTPVSEIV